jgi:hypothetical protein
VFLSRGSKSAPVPTTIVVCVVWCRDTKTLLASLSGPTPDGKDPALQSYKDIAAGMSVSTYPILGQLPNGDQTRAGDPNCDAFSLKFWKNRAIACVTDGCGFVHVQ